MVSFLLETQPGWYEATLSISLVLFTMLDNPPPPCKKKTRGCLLFLLSTGHFRVPLCLCFKASLSAKPFLWKWLWFAWNETACRTHFHMKGFALRLVLKQRRKRTWKWPIKKVVWYLLGWTTSIAPEQELLQYLVGHWANIYNLYIMTGDIWQ